MMVNGPLEIYGVVIGINFFDKMFNILASMGIVFIPILVLLFKGTTEPYESQLENGASTSLRKVSINFVLWGFVVMTFVAPTHKIKISEITYVPACYPSATKSTFGDTGTTYDSTIGTYDYGTLRMPIMMGFILSGMSGMTNALIASIPCSTNVQKIEDTIDTTNLTPNIAQEVNRFASECYAPAKGKFTTQHPDEKLYKDTMNSYGGQSDLSWIGSHVLQQLYYKGIYPSKPVPGFPYSEFSSQAQRDYVENNKKSGMDEPKWGYPDCYEWWKDGTYGLEGRLVDLVNKHSPHNKHLGSWNLYEKVKAWILKHSGEVTVGNEIKADDLIAHNLLYDMAGKSNAGFGSSGNWMNADIAPGEAGLHSMMTGNHGLSAGSGVAHLAAIAFQNAKSHTSGAVQRAEIENEIPILQAVLLAVALALGPMVILLGMMRGDTGIGVIFTYYFFIGSLLFLPFLERFLRYLETSIHDAHVYNILQLGNNGILYNVFTKLYFYAPMLYLMLMSIAGIGLGKAVGSTFSQSVSGESKLMATSKGGFSAIKSIIPK